MTFTDVKELADLPVGGKVVVDRDHDHPWTKVDPGWMDNGSVRIRVEHFDGAISAGHVAAYDSNHIGPWTVRRGPAYYSLVLEAEGSAWKCLRFAFGPSEAPDTLRHPGVTVLSAESLGATTVEPGEVPWQAFGKAMAGRLVTQHATIGQLQTELGERATRIDALAVQAQAASAVRDALRALLADDEGEDEDGVF